MARAFLDLGSNLDRDRSVAEALHLLAVRFRLLRTSSVYETAPVGRTDQPAFLNLAVEIETDLEPGRVREVLREIEEACGRVRSADRYAPRTVDLDLTLYEDRVEEGAGWKLPHPQVESEAFVLIPLAELEPQRLHPVRGRPLGELAAELRVSPGALRVVAPPRTGLSPG